MDVGKISNAVKMIWDRISSCSGLWLGLLISSSSDNAYFWILGVEVNSKIRKGGMPVGQDPVEINFSSVRPLWVFSPATKTSPFQGILSRGSQEVVFVSLFFNAAILCGFVKKHYLIFIY